MGKRDSQGNVVDKPEQPQHEGLDVSKKPRLEEASGPDGDDAEDKFDTPRLPPRSATSVDGFLCLDQVDDEATANYAFEMQNSQLIGTVISDRYEVKVVAGRGGMSTVYRALDRQTGGVVAFKVMHAHLLEDPTNVRRFRHEAAAARKVDHPHAVKLFEMGVTPYGSPYLIMEYIDGPSLAGVIKVKGKLPVDRCLNMFIQACDAMSHVHQLGVLHRDLKPSNIVLLDGPDGADFVKVVDFGIAKVLSDEMSQTRSRTPTGHVVGSPPYMSPEQCRAVHVDERSDVYSMGCLMYEALTGRIPLDGDTIMETMYKQINEMPPGLTGVEGDVRLVQRLESMLFKALAKDPAQRFQSMDELKKELESIRSESGKGLKIVAVAWREAMVLRRAIFNRLGSSRKLVLLLILLLTGIIALAVFFYSPLYGMGADPTQREREIPLRRSLNLYARNEADYKAKEGVIIAQSKLVANRFGGISLESMTIHKTFADFYRLSGHYHDALKQYGKAMSIAAQVKMIGSLDAAEMATSMAICCQQTGMYKSGFMCAEQARQILDGLGRNGTDEYLRALALKCEMARRIPDPGEASGAAQAFLNIWHAPGRTNTPKADMAESLFYVADYLVTEGNYKQAELLYKGAAVSWREKGSSGRYNYAIVLNRMGLAEAQRGDFNKACKYYDTAIDLFKRADGEDQLPVAKVLFNLKDAQWKKGDWINSVQNQVRARKLWESCKEAVPF